MHSRVFVQYHDLFQKIAVVEPQDRWLGIEARNQTSAKDNLHCIELCGFDEYLVAGMV